MTEPRSWAGTQRVSLRKESLEGLGRPGVDPHGLARDWGQSAHTHTHTHTRARVHLWAARIYTLTCGASV